MKGLFLTFLILRTATSVIVKEMRAMFDCINALEIKYMFLVEAQGYFLFIPLDERELDSRGLDRGLFDCTGSNLGNFTVAFEGNPPYEMPDAVFESTSAYRDGMYADYELVSGGRSALDVITAERAAAEEARYNLVRSAWEYQLNLERHST